MMSAYLDKKNITEFHIWFLLKNFVVIKFNATYEDSLL